MSTAVETQSTRERGWIYVTACVILIGLVIGALIAFSSARETREAQDKADELIAAIEDAGATAPSQDQIVRVLGDDGGATCEDPNDALNRAVLLSQLTNGATGPGTRPVVVDSRVFAGQLLIIEIYCPNELDDSKEFVEDLETDDVVYLTEDMEAPQQERILRALDDVDRAAVEQSLKYGEETAGRVFRHHERAEEHQ